MTRTREYLLPVGLFGLAVALVVPFLTPSPSAHAQTPHGIPIGATRIVVTQDHLDGESERLVRAFVRTGSDSPNILCTFAENDPGWGPEELAGLTMMCRPREFEVEGVGQKGVGVAIFFPFDPLDDPLVIGQGGEFRIDLTLYQQGARGYAEPVPCPEEC